MFKKELLIFFILFCALALGMHMNEWIGHPIKHLHNLANHSMPYHPLLYTSLLYLLIALIRFVLYALLKAFKRS